MAKSLEKETGGGAGMNVLSLLSRSNAADAEIRAEMSRLDVRSVGCPLEGALDELRESKLPRSRVVLLRACVEALHLEEYP